MAAIGEKVLAVFSVIWCHLVFVFQIPKFSSCKIIYDHPESSLVQLCPTNYLQIASIIARLNVTDRSETFTGILQHFIGLIYFNYSALNIPQVPMCIKKENQKL